MSLIRHLILHSWKESFRSVARHQTFAANILVGLLVVLLGINLLGVGFFLSRILREEAPGSDPTAIVNGVLLWYLMIDLLLRLWLQRIPAQRVVPYLHLPVSRNSLVHLLLARSAFSLFNLLPFLVLLPFAFGTLAGAYPPANVVAWCIAIFLLLLTNSYLNFLLQKLILLRLSFSWMLAPAFVALFALAAIGFLPLTALSRAFFRFLLENPGLVMGLWILPASVYWSNVRILREALYPESLPVGVASAGESSRGLSWLERKGTVGRLMALELKLLLRHRRTRATMIYGVMTIAMLIGLEWYWVKVVSVEERSYPRPSAGRLASLRAGPVFQQPGEQRVQIRVLPDSLPEGAWVYIAGNDSALGQWRAGRIPLDQAADGSWSRDFFFPRKRSIEFKVNLGSWETEALNSDGSRPGNAKFTVELDTAYTVAVHRWNVPEVSTVAQINILYLGVLMVGILMILYGQFIFAWECGCLEGMMARKIALAEYCRAKFNLLVAFGLLGGVLSSPVVFFDPTLAQMHGAIILYTLGVNSFVLLFMATFTRKRVDLNAGLFSLQGKGSVQFLGILPTLIPPPILFGFLWWQDLRELAIPALGLAGLAGLAAHRVLLSGIVRRFENRKYDMISGFRQS